jgi:hypothetical protein
VKLNSLKHLLSDSAHPLAHFSLSVVAVEGVVGGVVIKLFVVMQMLFILYRKKTPS